MDDYLLARLAGIEIYCTNIVDYYHDLQSLVLINCVVFCVARTE